MKVFVAGAGAWGTALAIHASRQGCETVLWARDPAVAESVERDRRHPRRHSDVPLPASLLATSELDRGGDADVVLLAVPSSAVFETVAALPSLLPKTCFLSAIKGFEVGTGRRVSEIVLAAYPRNPFAVLSGPTFADGVVRGDPTAAVVASEDRGVGAEIQKALSSPTFRLYGSEDVAGVELAGGLKNVIAIAAGIVTGLGFGANTIAALVTRGLAEMSRLVLASGGRERTLSGLAGVGDLLLTCTGPQSRNRGVGERIGRGEAPEAAMASVDEVAEGTRACLAAARLAARAKIEMPIADAVRRVLYEGLPPHAAIEALMTRNLGPE